MNVHFDGFREAGLTFLDAEQAAKLDGVTVKAKDVLLNITGASIGRVTLAPDEMADARVNQHVSIIRLKPEIEPGYTCSLLASPQMQSFIATENYGATRQALTKTMIENIVLPLPPAAEQRRIAAKINRMSTRSRRARDELKVICSLVEKYQSALLACEFEEIGIVQASFSEYVSDGLIGLVRSKDEQSDKQGTPYVRMQHFNLFGHWNWSSLTRVKVSEAEAQRYSLRPGDILFNTRNSSELVGKAAVWPGSNAQHVYNNNLLRLRFIDAVNPRFAYFQMRCPQFRERLTSLKSATTSVAAIYQKPLYQLPFWCPSIAIQDAIVRRIEHAFAAIDRLAAEAQSARTLLDKLDQAILAKAFRGELVPQDPDDEPASVLLDRIRAERAAAPAKQRRSSKR